MRYKPLVAAALITGTGLTAGAVYNRSAAAPPALVEDAVSRGSIASVVAATATVEAVTTVQVGSQVSGTVQAIAADFNAIVKKGQVLARLDPSLYESAIEQARANVARTEADLERLRVAEADATARLARARELSARQLIPATELDAAAVTERAAAAQVRSASAQVAQARAALSQAQVNLAKTVITSPIDGIVIARSVDVGQTVAASLQAPTLFVLAADLRQMQLAARIDESDLGSIAEGQTVRFTVDAWPGRTFTGTVHQVRLSPVVEQGVVTYTAMVSAPNPELKLMPGMTANVTVETARRDGVLRVPSAALRFRPSEELRRALGGDTAARAPAGSVVWMRTDGGLQPVGVTAGISDGTFTELVDAPLPEGARVVLRAAAGAAAGGSTASASPLLPSGQRGMPGPPR